MLRILLLFLFSTVLASVAEAQFTTLVGADSIRAVGDLAIGNRHGWQVELDGKRLAVSSRTDSAASLHSGSVSIFERREDGVYAFCQKIALGPSANGNNANLGDQMLMHGDLLFISAYNYFAPGAPCNGVLLVFGWDGAQYVLQQTLVPPSGSQYCAYGSHMEFDGEYLFVGASIDAEFGITHGSIYRYRLIGGHFVFEHRFYDVSLPFLGEGLRLTGDGRLLIGGNSKVVLVSGIFGANWVVEDVIYGPSNFAEYIEVYEDEVLVSMPRFDVTPFNRKGAIAIIDLHPVGMSFREFLYAPGQTVPPTIGDDFGSTFEIQGDWLYVGANGALGAVQNAPTGAAFVFQRVDDVWEPRYRLLPAPGGGHWDRMGKSITADGSRVVVGAPYTVVNGMTEVGTSYVFEIGFGDSVCIPAVANSSGEKPQLLAYGSNNASVQDLELRAEGVPGSGLALLLAASMESVASPIAFSDGQLCLGSGLRRLMVGPVSMGSMRFSIAWQHPLISSTPWLDPGTTTYFQAWYRDSNPLPTSNLTGAVAVLME